MKSCPYHAVESNKIHNGFETAVSQFETRQLSLSHTYSIGLKSNNKLSRGKTSDVLLIFVFLDDASTLRSCNVVLEHHVLAI